MSTWAQKFFKSQMRVCRYLDRRIFKELSVDGNGAFIKLVPEMVPDGARLADIGGGKTPFFSPAEVRSKGLFVAGIDIDRDELNAADSESYQEKFVGPIELVRGHADVDVVIAQSVLEHVRNGPEAAMGMASFLRKGGKLITFCPSKRAWFARLNVLLPERLKRTLLFYVFPSKRERQGYPAFYDGCSPQEFRKNLADAGVRVVEFRYFFTSSYFMCFVPLYLLWRLSTYPLMRFWPERYCETFICIGEKN